MKFFPRRIRRMEKEGAIRLLIADDHAAIREGLTVLLERQADMYVAGAACNGGEAIALFRRLLPDVTLMDIQMPEVSGIEAIVVILSEFPGAKVIAISAMDNGSFAHARSAGAAACLLKDASRGELLETIRGVSADPAPPNPLP